MVEQKRCTVRYHSFNSGKKRDYDLDPLKIFENNRGLYIFAYITSYEDSEGDWRGPPELP